MRSKSLRVCVALAGLAVGCGVLAAGATADNGLRVSLARIALPFRAWRGAFDDRDRRHRIVKFASYDALISRREAISVMDYITIKKGIDLFLTCRCRRAAKIT